MKTVKLLFFSVVFTLTFCFAAFASEKKIPATENFTNDVVYDNKSLDGGVTASGGAYSGMTRTFDLVFPVQNTTQKYGNGYKGTFTYTSVTGNVVSLEAGGYVYLNSSSSDAQ